MPQVVSLQHDSYYDRNTGITFAPLPDAERRIMRREEDELGRVFEYRAEGIAVHPDDNDRRLDIEDEDLLEYFRLRPNLYYVVEEGEADAPLFRVEHRTGPWYDVLNEDSERVDEDGQPDPEASALKEDEARERARELNS